MIYYGVYKHSHPVTPSQVESVVVDLEVIPEIPNTFRL